MQGDDSRILSERIVFRGQLHKTTKAPLPFDARHLQFVQPRSDLRRRGERRPHLPGDRRDGRGVEGLLLLQPPVDLVALRFVRRAEVVADHRPHSHGRQRELEVAVGTRGALQPAVDRHRQGGFSRHVGVGAKPFKRRQPVEGGERQPLLDLIDDYRGLAAFPLFLELCLPPPQFGEQPAGRLLPLPIAIAGFADRLDRLAAGFVGGELLQEVERQPILADAAADEHLVEQFGGGERGQVFPLLCQFGEIGEIPQHLVEFLLGVVVTLRLQEEPHHPQPIVGVGAVEMLVDHLFEHLTRNRRGRDPHVEQIGPLRENPLDARPTGGDLRDALHDVEAAAGGVEREDAAAIFVERRRAEDLADADHPAAALGNALRDFDPFGTGVALARCRPCHPPLRDHGSGQLVVAHQDGCATARFRAALGIGGDRDPRQEHETPLQHAAVGQFDLVGPCRGRW